MGLKNMSAFREFNKGNAQCDLYLKVCALTSISKLFKLKIALRNYKMEVLKTSKVVYSFKVLWIVSAH